MYVCLCVGATNQTVCDIVARGIDLQGNRRRMRSRWRLRAVPTDDPGDHRRRRNRHHRAAGCYRRRLLKSSKAAALAWAPINSTK